jgi:hypothetical protein
MRDMTKLKNNFYSVFKSKSKIKRKNQELTK